ncbi:MAG: DUF6879 family protein [Micromonosporaceae bacterium]
MLAAAELLAYIDDRLTREVFRLELLDRYEVESDGSDFARYLRGDQEPTPERKQPWLDRLARLRQAGIRNHRVHLLATPLTDYLRYECEWGYVWNARAGEEIGIIDRSEREAPNLPVDHDFCLIDDTHAVRMNYDDECRFVGAEQVDESDVAPYKEARDLLVHASEPFEEWWAQHPEEWRANRVA